MTELFRADARMHRIAEKLRAESSCRLDAMLTGHSPTSAENAVVVELEQWSDGIIGPSTAEARSNVLVTDISFSVIMPGIGSDRRKNR